MPTNLIPITLRIEEDLYDIVVELAEKEDRSINKQMKLLIKLGLERYKPNTKEKKKRV